MEASFIDSPTMSEGSFIIVDEERSPAIPHDTTLSLDKPVVSVLPQFVSCFTETLSSLCHHHQSKRSDIVGQAAPLEASYPFTVVTSWMRWVAYAVYEVST